MPTSMALMDDTALVQMALAGHSEYFGELMLRHMKMVRARVVAIARDSSNVDDVVQEVFFKAWRGLPRFRAEASLRTWLTSIATNEALMLCRREQRQRLRETPDGLNAVAWSGEPADKALIRGEVTQAIHGAIVNLPAKYREVVTLRDIEELTAPMVAKRLNASIPTVKTRLFRGRLRLAAGLRASGAEALRNAA